MTGAITNLQEFEQFIYQEVRYIDEQSWDKWLALFSEDGDYWIPISAADQNPGECLSILYEDHYKLELRCNRYSHPLIHSQKPKSKTCHVVSNVMFDKADEKKGIYSVFANFSMREFRQESRTDWFGTFEYLLKRKEQSFEIRRKKVLLVDSEARLETINIPF